MNPKEQPNKNNRLNSPLRRLQGWARQLTPMRWLYRLRKNTHNRQSNQRNKANK